MADQNTSIVNNDNLLLSYFERRMIKTLHERVYFYQLAEKYPLPQGSGTQITFNGWRKIPAASVTLGEASANSAVSLSSRKVNATIASYGRAVKVTELLELTSIIGPVEGAIRELEQSAALTVDNIIQLAVFKNVLGQTGGAAGSGILSALMSSTASSLCANTGTTGNSRQFGLPAVFGTSAARLSAVSATAPSISARLGPIGIRKAATRLRKFSVDPMANGKFVGVASPQALATMMGNSDWKQWHVNFSGGPSESMYKHSWGTVHGVELLESPNVPRYARAAHSVNITAIVGQGCLAVTELDGGVKMFVKRPGPQSTNDPFNLNSIVSYKVRGVAAVLNPSAGCLLFSHESQ